MNNRWFIINDDRKLITFLSVRTFVLLFVLLTAFDIYDLVSRLGCLLDFTLSNHLGILADLQKI